MKNFIIFPLLSLAFFMTGSPLFSAEKAAAVGSKGLTGMIAVSDTVSVSVFRESDLGSSGQLGRAGTLSMPLIGVVRLQGLTTDQAERLIEKKLRDGYLVRPEVSVRITGRVIQTVSVNGEVRNPGVFTIPVDRVLRFSEVIAMAGGPTDIANTKKVSVKKAKGSRIVIVNLRNVLNGKTNDFPLESGDVINIPEGWF